MSTVTRPKGNRLDNHGKYSKLTPQVHEAFVKSLRKGNYITTTCRALGIGHRTFYSWMEKGAPQPVYDDEGNVIGEEYPDNFYGEFVRDVHAADAEAETSAVDALTSHFDADWRAAADFLQRRFPDRWNPKFVVEHQGKDGGPIQVEEKKKELYAQLDVIDVESEELEDSSAAGELEEAT